MFGAGNGSGVNRRVSVAISVEELTSLARAGQLLGGKYREKRRKPVELEGGEWLQLSDYRSATSPAH
jgi:hypothetical protein